MKKYRSSKSAFFNSRVLVGLAFCSIVTIFALLGLAISPGGNAMAETKQSQQDIATGPAYGSLLDGAPNDQTAPSAPIVASPEINRTTEWQPNSSCAVAFSENFDSVVAPALPAGWVATNALGVAPFWVTSITTPDTAPNTAFVDDPATVSDKYLDTPSIVIGASPALLSFRNFYNTESTFDGGVLEVSSPNINVGAFTDVTAVAVGGSFINGGYNGLISTAFTSPIGGRMAWTGSSTTFINTLVDLGPNVIGQTIKLRFRMASDNSVAVTGWRVDTISLSVACGTPSPTPTATPDASGCSWSAATVVPATVLDMPVVTVGSNLYAFGGVSTAIVATSRKFDGTTWSAIASLPVALEFPAAVTNGTDIYILGGAEPTAGTPQTTVNRYNVGADTYTAMAPFTTGTWNHAAVYLNGKIYKFAGTGPSTSSTNVMEIYDVGSNTWSLGASYPLAISFVSAFVQGNFIYACGGIDSATSTASVKTYRYDPGTNTWDDLAIADLPSGRWGSACAFYNNKGVLAGGYVGGSATANISTSVIAWDSGSNTWGTLPNMLGERSRMTGAILNGCFHVVGGRSIASSAFVGTNDNQKLCCALGPTPTPCPLCTPTPSPTPAPTPTPVPTASPTAPPCNTFSNATAIPIPDSGASSLYPSNIAVSGLGGTVTNVWITLNGITHTFPDDIDILLVGPGGETAIVMSDVGGSIAVTNVVVTLADSAGAPIPDAGPLVNGTFQPTNVGTGDTWPAPAPVPAGTSVLSVFNGTNPNGTWNLYVFDDAGGDLGSIANGWSISVTTTSCAGPTATPNPTGTPSPSPTVSPSPTAAPTPTPAPTPTATPCPISTTVLSQDFEAGLGAWTIDNATTVTTCPTAVDWTVRTNPYDPSLAGCGGSGSQTPLNSGGGTSFAMSDSDAGGSGVLADARLNSPSFNTVGMSTLRLSYRHFYRALGTSVGAVEVSISGAAGPWINVESVTTTQGAAAAFVADSVVLDAFVGNADTRIRFRYTAGWDWWWAIDDVLLTTCSGATPSPSPTPQFVISGKVANCSSPAPTATPPATPTPPVLPGSPNVLMTLSGSASGTTLTDGSGNYSFTVNGGGTYTITPSKTAIPPAGPNINNLDVLAIQRHFLLITTIPAGCRLTAADANVNAIVNGQDVLAVQRFFLGFTSGTGSVGQYKFVPASRSYPSIAGNQTAQNYEMYVVGDAAAAFNNRPGSNENDMGFSSVAFVALPDVALTKSMSDFTAPVTTSAVDASERMVGFQGDFTFDERVVQFAREPVEKAGLTAGNWTVAGNVLPGNGPIRTLRILGYSNDFTPLKGAGTLFQLRMEQVNRSGEGTPLVWAAPPDNFIFINADLQTQRPGGASPGSVSQRRSQR